MADFLFLMHSDGNGDDAEWDAYLTCLQEAQVLRGGSRIGGGACFRKNGEAPEITEQLGGYIKIEAADFDAARAWLAGNPVFENGGTVEIRELPRDV
jgi:hypothetical protein